MQDSDFLAALRAETRSWHDRLERRVDLPRRLADRASYAALLAAFHGLYAPLEHALAGAGLDAGFELDARRKLPLLTGDLAMLGVDAAALPRCGALPPLDTPARAAGALYVMEGATLGGQLIGRELALGLRLDASNGAGFFAGYGPRTGAMWTRFRQNLATLASDEGRRAQVIGSAAATFAVFDGWIAHCDETRPSSGHAESISRL